MHTLETLRHRDLTASPLSPQLTRVDGTSFQEVLQDYSDESDAVQGKPLAIARYNAMIVN